MVVNNTFSKVNARLKFMYCHSSILSSRARKNTCSALILCHLDYYCSSCYAGLTKCLKKKLQIAQKKVIRFINSLGHRSRVTADTLGESNLLNVETQVNKLRQNNVHKIFYDLCPTNLKENFFPLKDVHQYCTRSSHYNALVPHCQNLDKSTVTYVGIADWNSLLECLKAIEKPQRFKVALIYLMKYFQETELCDFFCFTESMIHMHLFHPVLFGCDNHIGFQKV